MNLTHDLKLTGGLTNMFSGFRLLKSPVTPPKAPNKATKRADISPRQ